MGLQVVFLAIFIGLILLIPSYVLTLRSSQARLSKIEDIRNNPVFQENDELRETLKETKRQLAFFKPEESFVISEVIMKPILEYGDDEGLHIHFNELLFEEDEEDMEKVMIRIQGTAGTRDNLIAFVNNLKEEPLFEEIELPVSSFVKNEDLEFMLTLHATKKALYE